LSRSKSYLAFSKLEFPIKYPTRFAHFPYIEQKLNRLAAAPSRSMTVLDVGCGPGHLAAFYQPSQEVKLYGVELWDYQLKQAAARNRYSLLCQANLIAGLPFRDDSFDAVVCGEVLMYLPDKGYMLSELHRVLRSGGNVFIYDPITWFPGISSAFRILVRKFHREKKAITWDGRSNWKNAERPARVTFHSPRTLVGEISAFFDITDQKGFRLFRNRISWMKRLENYRPYFRFITGLAGRFPYLATDLLIVGRKKRSS
jgi:SAM-dependent methyltransferase